MKLLSIYLTLVVSSSVYAAPMPPTYREGMMNFSLATEYFTTNANWDRYGNKWTLPTNNKFTTINTTLDGTFDFEGNFAVGGGVGLGMSTARTESIGNPLIEVTNNNSQITDAHFVGQYFIDFARFRLVPELKGSLTFQTYNLLDSLNTAPLTSDGTNKAQAGSWGIINFGKIRGWGYLGFMYQDDGRANLMPWEAGLLWRNRNIMVSGSFDGYQTVINDTWSNTNPYVRQNRTDFADGGSYRYYATNPSLTEFRIYGGYAFENNLVITLGYATMISGIETAVGDTIYGGVSFGMDMAGTPGTSFDALKKKHRPVNQDGSPMAKPMEATPSQNGGFQPDLEQYDESLFD